MNINQNVTCGNCGAACLHWAQITQACYGELSGGKVAKVRVYHSVPC
jgi:hypothetical protein